MFGTRGDAKTRQWTNQLICYTLCKRCFWLGQQLETMKKWIIEKKVKRHKRTASICIYTRRDFATPNWNDRCHFLGGASFPRIIENTVFCYASNDFIILAAPANQPNTRTPLATNRLKTGLFAMLHRSSWCFCARENVHRSWALGNHYTETEADKHLFFWQRKKRTWHRPFFLDARKLTPRWSRREKPHTKTELTNRVRPTSWCTIWAILQKTPKPDTQTHPSFGFQAFCHSLKEQI